MKKLMAIVALFLISSASFSATNADTTNSEVRERLGQRPTNCAGIVNQDGGNGADTQSAEIGSGEGAGSEGRG